MSLLSPHTPAAQFALHNVMLHRSKTMVLMPQQVASALFTTRKMAGREPEGSAVPQRRRTAICHRDGTVTGKMHQRRESGQAQKIWPLHFPNRRPQRGRMEQPRAGA
jgi:hypothetical protein